MKKYILYFTMFLTLLAIFSCKQRDEEVYSSSSLDVTRGGFVKFETAPPAVVDGSNPSATKFSAKVIDPNGNADYYETTTVSGTIGGVAFTTSNYIVRISSFPGVLEISLPDLAKLLGKPATAFIYGDQINVQGKVVTKNGITYPTSTTVGGTAYSNAYPGLTDPALNFFSASKFSFLIACPSVNLDAMVGSFTVWDDWNDYKDNFTVQVVKGSLPNELIIKNFSDAGTDLSVIVDPLTSKVTVAKQFTGYTDPTYGKVYAESTGSNLIFTCGGKMNLMLKYTVTAGSFGSFAYRITKI